MGLGAESAYWSFITTYILVNIVRIYMMKQRFNFPVLEFLSNVVGRIILTISACAILPVFIVNTMESSYYRLIVTTISCTISTAILVYFIGLSVKEQNSIVQFIKSKIIK